MRWTTSATYFASYLISRAWERKTTKISRFSEPPIALLLKQVDDGVGIEEVCHKVAVSMTFGRWTLFMTSMRRSARTAHRRPCRHEPNPGKFQRWLAYIRGALHNPENSGTRWPGFEGGISIQQRPERPQTGLGPWGKVD